MIAVPPGYYVPGKATAVVETFKTVITTTAKMILPFNYRRVGCVIKNVGSVNIDVGNENSVLNGSGHVLAPNDSLAMVTPAEVWAVAESSSGTVSVFSEVIR